jgi:hypothetical protein
MPAMGPTEADSLFFLFIISSEKVFEDGSLRAAPV